MSYGYGGPPGGFDGQQGGYGGPPGGHHPPPEHHAPPQLGHAPPQHYGPSGGQVEQAPTQHYGPTGGQVGQAPPQHYGPTGGHAVAEGGDATSAKGITVKIFSQANTNFNLGVRGHEVVIMRAVDSDPYQQWIKDESWSNKAKDSAGLPGFALINRGSGLALTHPPREEEKVSLVTYHSNSLNEETLWTVSKDVGHGWHAIRPINNVKLNLDIDHGSKKYGPISDGKAIIVFHWKDEENQHWKMTNISSASATSQGHHHLGASHGASQEHHHHKW